MSEKVLVVPSKEPLTYCRLCFSKSVFKKIAGKKDLLSWIERVRNSVGVELSLENDWPFALCYGCCITLESVEQFRERCQTCDAALRKYRNLAPRTVGIVKEIQIGTNPAGPVVAAVLQRSSANENEPEQWVIERPRNTQEQASNTTEPVIDTGEGSEQFDDSEMIDHVYEEENDVHKLLDAAQCTVKDWRRDRMCKCYACGIDFPNLSFYESHIRIQHPKASGYIECTRCSSKCRQYGNFQRHCLKHLKPTRNMTCDVCETAFECGEDLSAHQVMAHNLTFECVTCYKRYGTAKLLQEHKLYHIQPDGDREFECKFCTKKFPNKDSLRTHIKKHNQRYICATCNAEFAIIKSYMEHQQVVHKVSLVMGENSELYKCLPCNILFTYRRTYIEHISRKHVKFDTVGLDSDDDQVVVTVPAPSTQQTANAMQTTGNTAESIVTVIKQEPADEALLGVVHTNAAQFIDELEIKIMPIDINPHIKEETAELLMAVTDKTVVAEEIDSVKVKVEAAEVDEIEQIEQTIIIKDPSPTVAEKPAGTLVAANECYEDSDGDDGEDSAEPSGPNEHEARALKKAYSNRICKCYSCVISFPTLLLYETHIRMQHPKVGGYVECPRCKSKFRQYGNFQRHSILHLKPTRNKTCDICADTFTTGGELSLHQAEIHKLEFECKRCFKRFKTPSLLKEHDLYHEQPDGDREFECKFCNQKFPSKADLALHIKKHKKRYVCEMCPEQFTKLKAYLKHQRVTHDVGLVAGESSMYFKCSPCNILFTYRRSFTDHVGRKHVRFVTDFGSSDDESDGDESTSTPVPTESVEDSVGTAQQQVEQTQDVSENNKEVPPSEPVADDDDDDMVEIIEGDRFKEEPVEIDADSDEEEEYEMLEDGSEDAADEEADREVVEENDNTAESSSQPATDSQTVEDDELEDDEDEPNLSAEARSRLTSKWARNRLCKCYACVTPFTSLMSYQTHIRSEHPRVDGFIKCPRCYSKFRQYGNFQRHCILHLKPTRNQSCDVCSKTFNNLEKLSRHQAAVHKLDYECKLCYKRFGTLKLLKEHKLYHVEPDGDRKFECKFCTKTFPSKATVALHMERHNQRYACSTCDQQFVEIKEYMEHQRITHNVAVIYEGKSQYFKCLPCNILFAYRRSYMNHISRKHVKFDPNPDDGDEPLPSPALRPSAVKVVSAQQTDKEQESAEVPMEVNEDSIEDLDFDMDDDDVAVGPVLKQSLPKCYACAIDFANHALYESHITKDHPKVGGYAECSRCLKKFREYSNFQRHCLKHYKPTKNLTCDACGEPFNSGEELSRHQVAIHKLDYECKKCFKRFKTLDFLKDHKQYHLQPDGDREFDCRFCVKKFPNKASLVLHIEKHKQRYCCGSCRAQFGTIKAYTDHQRRDHDVALVVGEKAKYYKCLSCNILFSYRRSYVLHINRKHMKVRSTVEDSPPISDNDEFPSTSKSTQKTVAPVNTASDSAADESLEPVERSASADDTSSTDFRGFDDEDDDDDIDESQIVDVRTEDIKLECETENAEISGLDSLIYPSDDEDEEGLGKLLTLDQVPAEMGFDIYGAAFHEPKPSTSKQPQVDEINKK